MMKLDKSKEIPMMFCLNNQYSIPAATAFVSLLTHADPNYYYQLFVLHNDITPGNQQKIRKSIAPYTAYSDVTFVNMQGRFDTIWQEIEKKSHFSKETLYKLIAAEIFPQYEKIIISDVDVCFLGKSEYAQVFFEFDVTQPYYLAGVHTSVSKNDKNLGYDAYLQSFSTQEVLQLQNGCCGGFLIANLALIRKDDIQKLFVECLVKNMLRLLQAEQDVFGLCCYGKIKFIALNFVVCTYLYDDVAKNSAYLQEMQFFSQQQAVDALHNPVQLHFACAKKPWGFPHMTKAEIWYKYFKKTAYSPLMLLPFRYKAAKLRLYWFLMRCKAIFKK